METFSEKDFFRIDLLHENESTPSKKISHNQYQKLKYDSECINAAYTQFSIYAILKIEFNAFTELVNQGKDVPVQNILPQYLTSKSLEIHSNRIVINVLSSFLMFIDNANYYFERAFPSYVSENFRKFKSKMFDEHFEYKLCYKLRHYAVHMTLPLEPATFIVNEDGLPVSQKMGNISYHVNVSKLLMEKKVLGAPLTSVLLQMDTDKINMCDVFNELEKIVEKIQCYIYGIQRKPLLQLIENIESFIELSSKTDENMVVFIKKHDNNENFFLYSIPVEAIREFKNFEIFYDSSPKHYKAESYSMGKCVDKIDYKVYGSYLATFGIVK